MIKKNLRVAFNNSHLLLETRAIIEYQFPFTVVDSSLLGRPEEENETKKHIIRVSISDILASKWELRNEDLEKVLYEYSKRYITKKLKRGTLKEKEELELLTLNCPNECPYDPSRIPETGRRSFDIEIMIEESP